MKIELSNFRGFEKKIVELKESNGLILIDGASGSGKSSICYAIYFCLYGKLRNPCFLGYKKSYVEVTYQDLIITRSKSPDHLTVRKTVLLETSNPFDQSESHEVIFEDEQAQEVVNEVFGDQENFFLTSFLPQKASESFLLLNSNDKIQFLEKLIINDERLPKFKEKLGEIISENNAKQKENGYKINSSTDEVDRIKKKQSMARLNASSRGGSGHTQINPFKKLTNEEISNGKYHYINQKEEISRVLAETERNRDRIVQQIMDNNEQVNRIKQKEISYESILSKIATNEDSVKQKNKDLDELFDKKRALKDTLVSDLVVSKYSRTLEYYTENKRLEAANLEIKSLNVKYEAYKTDEKKSRLGKKDLCEKEIARIQHCYSIDSSLELKDLQNDCKSWLRNDDISCEIFSIENEISAVQKSLNALIRTPESSLDNISDSLKSLTLESAHKDKLTCPECKCELSLSEDRRNLISNSKINEKINKIRELDSKKSFVMKSKLDTQVKFVSRKLCEDKIKSIAKDILSLAECSSELKTLNYNLDNNVYSGTILSIEKDINNLENRKRELDLTTNVNTSELFLEYSESEILEKISSDTYSKKIYKDCLETIQKLQASLDNASRDLNIIGRHGEELRGEIFQLNLDLALKRKENSWGEKDLNKDLENVKKELDNIKVTVSKYDSTIQNLLVHEEKEEIDFMSNKLAVLKNVDSDLSETARSLIHIKNSMSEVEQMYTKNLINTLNIFIKDYLDLFFVDNAMQVTIENETMGEGPLIKNKSKREIKNEIKVCCSYKNNNFYIDNKTISDQLLSAGEFDRLVLSFLLSFSKIVKSPILMLDESLSTIDSANCNMILDVIKTHCKNKICVVILHQGNRGLFSQIVDL